MNSYLKDKDRAKCCGCAMCEYACPTKAIKMCQDEEGFAFPSVNTELCIECGRCSDVCPVEIQPKYTEEPRVYAAYSKDDGVLMHSSSGGIFTEIAKSILAKGGLVCGCTIDEKYQVKHIVIDKEEDIALLQGSKYVQSELGSCLNAVETALKSDKTLLFVGTPCQVAAVKNNFDCEKLITVDIVCHGVPSQKLFDFYIDHLEKKHNGVLTEIVFRDKEKYGWSITQRYKIQRKGKEKTYYLERHLSEYFSGYIRNMTQRISCYSCPFTTKERVADITLGDFWGIERVRPELRNADGTSLVLANSDKGFTLIDQLEETVTLNKVSFEEASIQNANFKMAPDKHSLRDVIYSHIYNEGFRKCGRQYLLPRNSYKYRIANLFNINLANVGHKKM